MSKNGFCCPRMEQSVVDDTTIFYSDVFDEYGIVFPEDEVSMSLIRFCPWCGKKLPESKREEWFKRLEELGFDAPLFDENIPIEFKSSKWRN